MKIVLIIACILLVSFIAANKVEIEFPGNDNNFNAGEPISFKATIYNDNGQAIDGEIQITIEDSNKAITKTTAQSKNIVSMSLPEASSGQGLIRGESANVNEGVGLFFIEADESVSFDIIDGVLIVKNMGNTRYSNTITITIGETTGTQTPNLDIGESASYRLIAPEGDYNIKVDDGKNTPLTRSNVRLTGTGNVIGAVDNSGSSRTGITGGVSPDESNIALLAYLKSKKFVYVFVGVIFAATILVAIERRYKKTLKR